MELVIPVSASKHNYSYNVKDTRARAHTQNYSMLIETSLWLWNEDGLETLVKKIGYLCVYMLLTFSQTGLSLLPAASVELQLLQVQVPTGPVSVSAQPSSAHEQPAQPAVTINESQLITNHH